MGRDEALMDELWYVRCPDCGLRVEVGTNGRGRLVDLDPVTRRPHECPKEAA